MDRNAVLRWALIALALLLLFKFGIPGFGGGKKTVQPIAAEIYKDAPGFEPDAFEASAKGAPKEGELCTVTGERFRAELSTRGAALVHFFVTDAHYAEGTPQGFDVGSTPDHERWRSLRTLFRPLGQYAQDDQLEFDRFNWTLKTHDGSSCVFTYEDAHARVEKTVRASGKPFELEVSTAIENLSNEPRKHKLAVGAYAFRFNKDVKGNLGRVSPFMTELTCASTAEVVRKNKDDFKEGWFEQTGTDRFAAVSNYYFGQALVPMPGAAYPQCRLLAEAWFGPGQAADDDNAGAAYHAMLDYPAKTLAPHEQATYKQTAFFGPKERPALAQAGGGRAKLGDLINLGFFSIVAKVLVSILLFLHDHATGQNWGLAIVAMTICLRVCLFPLALPQIKTTLAMRKLRPELEAISAKFKDDAGARQMATMELHKKHGINMFGGCLPQLVQMPVWWAMYTTLQTAVEMYHTKFLWFKDLSAADTWFILPIVLGGLGFLQARIMPQQPGQDPQQQKMMMYMMPAIFTVMMLFLPAALGVYMTTNSILGIGQQLLIEQLAKRSAATAAASEIQVKEVNVADKAT